MTSACFQLPAPALFAGNLLKRGPNDMNDNIKSAVSPIDADALPAEYKGRVTIIIEIAEGNSMNINGVSMSLSEGVALMDILKDHAE
jgi:hypothetical protein